MGLHDLHRILHVRASQVCSKVVFIFVKNYNFGSMCAHSICSSLRQTHRPLSTGYYMHSDFDWNGIFQYMHGLILLMSTCT